MKRRVLLIPAVISVLVLVLTTIVAYAQTPTPTPEPVNLVQNPGFEEPATSENDPPTSWTANGASLRRSTDAYAGSYSAYVYAADSYYTQTMVMSPLAAYKYSAFLKAGNATARAELMIQDSNHVNLLDEPLVLSNSESAWAKRLTALPTLDTAYYAVITLKLEATGDNPEAYFDDIVLIQKAGCFIATAAYGTDTAEELDVLRAFRDQVLLKDPIGSRLVNWYYDVSPPAADFIARHNTLRTVVRELVIDPIVTIARFTQGIWGD
jgi:hypothetical protein